MEQGWAIPVLEDWIKAEFSVQQLDNMGFYLVNIVSTQ